MTPTETAATLRQFNEWRRGDDETIEQPDPREIGEAIDAAIEMIDRLEATEKDNALKEKLIDRLALELNSASFKRDALSVDRATLQQMLYSIKNRLEAAEKSDAESIAMYRKARDERDELRAKIEAMEQQEPFDADSDVFRSAFEAALKAGNWPMTRQGDGYRSPSTQIAWRIAFSTVNRLKLYRAPGAKGE